MTVQVKDTIHCDGEDFGLTLLQPYSLFDPEQCGFKPTMISTACYRGFYCTYDLTEGQFHLTSLTIVTEDDQYPQIDGITGVSESPQASRKYTGLRHPITWSGEVFVGTRILGTVASHLRISKSHEFAHVFELTLDSGKIISSREASIDKVGMPIWDYMW